MRTKPSAVLVNRSLAVLAATLILMTSASAVTETVIFRFKNLPGTLIFDSAGNLYGMTSLGGGHNGGTVFKLSPGSHGAWTKTVLHNFDPQSRKDGGNPFSSGLVFDSAGNLYGTTTSGGRFERGTVFELTPAANGTWTETILCSFGPVGSNNGEQPLSGLVFDAAGNLYGTTSTGGAWNAGTVFELSPVNRGWAEKVIYSFAGAGDGVTPIGGVVFDKAGNLYGTTFAGGRGAGIVFELSPGSSGIWSETVLHRFKHGSDGGRPYAGLVMDQAGNFYGTAEAGGTQRKGLVFALTPATGGGWTMTTIHAFAGPPGDGSMPVDALIVDATGNLYGTTLFGGTDHLGTVFKLAPASGGGWTESVLYSFTGGSSGRSPFVGVVPDSAGHLFGTSVVPKRGPGIVFEITP
jgi:uncharacterized repeat protein (TIGR03803 family)